MQIIRTLNITLLSNERKRLTTLKARQSIFYLFSNIISPSKFYVYTCTCIYFSAILHTFKLFYNMLHFVVFKANKTEKTIGKNSRFM